MISTIFDPNRTCPYFGKPCRKEKCTKYINVVGREPQSGELINQWGCVDNFNIYLLMELAGEMRQATASTQQVRNEMAKGMAAATSLQQLALQMQNEEKHQLELFGGKDAQN